MRAVLKDEDGNEVSQPYIDRRNTKNFIQFAAQTEADFRDRTDVTFLEVGEENDGNFMVLKGNVTYLACTDSSNTFLGEQDGVLTFANAGDDLNALKAGDLFAFMNDDGEYENVKIKAITVNDGTVSITRDEEVYLADFYDVIKINADLTYVGEEEVPQPAMLRAAPRSQTAQLLKVEFGPALTTNLDLGPALSTDAKIQAGGKVSVNYDPKLLGEDYMDMTLIAGVKGELDVTVGAADNWKDDITMGSIPLAGLKEVLGASMNLELICQIDAEIGYNFTLGFENTYGFVYSTDTSLQVVRKSQTTQREASSESKIKGEVDVEVGVRGELSVSLLDELIEASAGAEGGLAVEGELDILSGTLPSGLDSYHACDLCMSGDCKSYFEVDVTLDYEINSFLKGNLIDLDIVRIETTLGSFYLSLFNDADSVHKGAVVFGWADSCPNKKYRVEIRTYNSESNSEVSGCTVAVLNANHNSDTITSPGKLFLYPGTYTAKATIGLNEAKKTFTVVDAAMTVQLNGKNKVLSGQVSDMYTKQAVPGATVKVNQDGATIFSATTSESGWYSINLPDGEYTVSFSADGYESEVRSLTIKADKALDVALESKPYDLNFDANGGEGTMSSMKFHYGQTVTLPGCTFTPPEGKVFRGWLVGGMLCDAGTSYQPSAGNKTIVASWIDQSFKVTVKVTYNNKAASGLAIAGTGLAPAPVTGTDGSVTFELPVGSYKLSATNANNCYDSAKIELTEDTTVTLTLTKPVDPNWDFDEKTGVLTITGNGGPMPDYNDSYNKAPWRSHFRDITAVKLSGVTTIGNYAFWDCDGLTEFAIPDEVTAIGKDAFGHCGGLTSITIPDGVTSIGYQAFLWCDSLTSVTIPDSVTTIGGCAFQWCEGLTSVTIPNSVTTIGGYAFAECTGLTSVTIPDSITTITGRMFFYCKSLTSVTIPDSVTTIDYQAFAECDSLTSITIPVSVTTISDGAFQYCDALADVYYGGSAEDWTKVSIASGNDSVSNATIHYNSQPQ